MILAFETGAETYSVGLFENGVCLAHSDYDTPRLHARLITHAAHQLLNALDLAPRSLKAVAVTGGPGSYTGLRIGGAAAKGLAFALDIPLLRFSTLESIASAYQYWARTQDAYIVPLLDAKRMEAYYAVYDSALIALAEPAAVVIDETFLRKFDINKRFIFCGNGVEKCAALIHECAPQAFTFIEPSASVRNLGTLLQARYDARAFEDVINFEPDYIKDVNITQRKKSDVLY